MVTRKSAVEKPEHPLSVTFRLRSGCRSASGSGYIDVTAKRRADWGIDGRWASAAYPEPSSSALLRRRPGRPTAKEKIFEAYYSYKLNRLSALTFDYQFIADPAYNADRGPVSIFSARAHAEF